MRLVSFLGVILLLCLASGPAAALPAPLSDDDLLAQSDLVARVRVVSVTCTSIDKDKHTGEELPSYVAKLEMVEVKKGDVAPGATVSVAFHAIPQGVLGPWTVYYYPGEEVWTHLVSHGGDAYATTWWNAKGKPLNAPEIKKLPTKVGETVVASGL